MQGLQVVVPQFEPLQRVQVVKGVVVDSGDAGEGDRLVLLLHLLVVLQPQVLDVLPEALEGRALNPSHPVTVYVQGLQVVQGAQGGGRQHGQLVMGDREREQASCV